jgi:hypothetical protein
LLKFISSISGLGYPSFAAKNLSKNPFLKKQKDAWGLRLKERLSIDRARQIVRLRRSPLDIENRWRSTPRLSTGYQPGATSIRSDRAIVSGS